MFHYGFNSETNVKMSYPETGILDQVSRNFADLSPQLQLAARFVMDNPQEVATHSLRHIAKQSGLSPPTFSRLARAIGFEEYEMLRDGCRNQLKQRQVSLAQRANLLQSSGDELSATTRGSFAAKHARVAVGNIQALIDSIDTEQLADATDLLADADRVVLLGAQSSLALANYMKHIAAMASPRWQVADQTSLPAIADLTDGAENTAVITMSVTPYLNRTIQVTEQAAGTGATVIAITDDIRSPLLKYADHRFIVPTDSMQFFPSHVAILTLLEIMIGMVVRRIGEDANNRIDSVEKLGHAIGDYFE